MNNKFVLTVLVVCIAAQGVLIVKSTDVSDQQSSSHLLLSAFSDTTMLFLSLQNRSKKGSIFSASDGSSLIGLGVYGLWNTFQVQAFKSDGHLNSLCQAAAPESLYALCCQFTI